MSEQAVAAEVQAQVRNLFPTPVATLLLPDGAAINADMGPRILAREASHPSVEHSNLGGWQSPLDLPQWGGPGVAAVLQAATRLADRLTRTREGKEVKSAWKTACWANVNRRSHGNEFHTHPGCFWSGTYYVDDGGVAEDPALGGEFEIQDPRGVAPVMYAPLLTFAGPDGPSLGASELLRPRAGMLVLFPSWLQHAVRPYHGTGVRISIAFNLSL